MSQAVRIEVRHRHADTRALVQKRRLDSLGFKKLDSVSLVDVYTVDAGLDSTQLSRVASMLANPVIQEARVGSFTDFKGFDWAIEVGFLPGVTDNVGATAREGIEDLFKLKLTEGEGVYSSQLFLLKGRLSSDEVEAVAQTLYNPLIQRAQIKSFKDFNGKGMDAVVPRVRLGGAPKATLVDLSVGDEELKALGRQGIPDGIVGRRGPLALDLDYLKAIQSHFKGLGRKPTDLELESIAQTWSEHCKHTIFADELDEVKEGLFKAFIKGATDRIRREKGDKDFCVSVFTDNSGGIAFDGEFAVTDKVETHNSPSALDPFGGAVTGIVGVNRDCIGFGLGAKPVINKYGYCFASPGDSSPLYKNQELTEKMLPPRRIIEGVVSGVNAGGNCSGIPTPQGFVYFDKQYKGKPLVFVGTIGLIPRKSNGRNSFEKKAQPGDYIVMVGGRVGQDGIHGATFSSEALGSGSPATAVQIGDPVTQKKLSDAIVKEARDLGLYNSITDNGAGGLSCSVAEMARECNGCIVYLHDVPLKYPGLEPWKIWVSESQERMTLSVPGDKWNDFKDLMQRRGVEATVIGEFTDSGKCVVEYNGEKLMDLDLEFLHNGLPPRALKTHYSKPSLPDPEFDEPTDLAASFLEMLSRPNLASFAFISQQYDHEVQGGSVIKPLQGRGRVNGDASVTRPLLESAKGVVAAQALYPSYSDLDPYSMAACAIDTAVRNAVVAGAPLDQLALLDNFCWCSSNEPSRLGQLKEAAKACYDYAVAYGTPFISGKDSMFNDFKGFDAQGRPVKVSVPPTLLISATGVMSDSFKAVSLDAKLPGDLVYVLGETFDELGGSEYYAMMGEKLSGKKLSGGKVPRVDAARNKALYESYSKCVQQGIVASAQSVHRGGLAAALAKTALGGMLGVDVSLNGLPGKVSRNDYALYSETQGRILATIAPRDREAFEALLDGKAFKLVGRVTEGDSLLVTGLNNEVVVDVKLSTLSESYNSTFGGW